MTDLPNGLFSKNADMKPEKCTKTNEKVHP